MLEPMEQPTCLHMACGAFGKTCVGHGLLACVGVEAVFSFALGTHFLIQFSLLRYALAAAIGAAACVGPL